MKLPKFTALLFAGSLTLAVAACGKPSVDGAESRYKANKDKISVLITKQPANKAEFEKKIAEFEKEHETAMAAGSDEEKIKKLGSLNSRMEKYLGEFEKADASKAGAAKTGGAGGASKKLDGTAPAGTPPASGGKLGGPAPAQPASGGMGGGTAQPASGGMGGGSTAPASGGTAPAQPASGGMGGQ